MMHGARLPPTPTPGAGGSLRLLLARAVAWCLLLAGWAGLGALAMARTADMRVVHAVVALWLLALGLAAGVATRDALRPRMRRAVLALCGALTATALVLGGATGAWAPLALALVGWAGMTALASGVVRSARWAQAAPPGPPAAAAALGALVAALLLGDPGETAALALRLGFGVAGLALALALLQPGERAGVPPGRCRAGLFDCSLPAWPAGAWADAKQWPTLLAGLAMLPMMAGLPAMAAWCRGSGLSPEALVGLHVAAMFAPAWLLRQRAAAWPARHLALACTLLLAAGAAAGLWAPRPWDMIGVTLAQGCAWSLAWSGQLWAPQRRSQQGSSPWRAAMGYAALTLVVGVALDRLGPDGLVLAQAALGAAALAAVAWTLATRRALATG
jgi:hypothetical protein